MRLVVDANVIVSSLIKQGKTTDLLFNEKLDLLTPEFVLDELEEHKQEVLDKTHRNAEEFAHMMYLLR